MAKTKEQQKARKERQRTLRASINVCKETIADKRKNDGGYDDPTPFCIGRTIIYK